MPFVPYSCLPSFCPLLMLFCALFFALLLPSFNALSVPSFLPSWCTLCSPFDKWILNTFQNHRALLFVTSLVLFKCPLLVCPIFCPLLKSFIFALFVHSFLLIFQSSLSDFYFSLCALSCLEKSILHSLWKAFLICPLCALVFASDVHTQWVFPSRFKATYLTVISKDLVL